MARSRRKRETRRTREEATSTSKTKRKEQKTIPDCAPFYEIAVKRNDEEGQKKHHGESEDDSDDSEDSGESIGEGESMYGGSHINYAGYIGTDEDFSDLSHRHQSSISGDDSDNSWIAANRNILIGTRRYKIYQI